MSARPILWDEDLDQAIAQHWIAQQLKGTGKLTVDAKVVRRRKRGTGGKAGHPRAVPALSNELIAEARADFLEHGPQMNRRGDIQLALSHVFSFLENKGVTVDEEKQHKTVARRIIKGEDYKP
jgi:hypothetical protein